MWSGSILHGAFCNGQCCATGDDCANTRCQGLEGFTMLSFSPLATLRSLGVNARTSTLSSFRHSSTILREDGRARVIPTRSSTLGLWDILAGGPIVTAAPVSD